MNADYHIHTSFSSDSSAKMEDYIKQALALNLDEICFTDHTDYGNYGCFSCNFESYFKEIKILQEKYGGFAHGIQKDLPAEAPRGGSRAADLKRNKRRGLKPLLFEWMLFYGSTSTP